MQKGFAPIIILAGLVILLVILFVLLPYYENSERCTLIVNQLSEPSTKCTSKGWHLGTPIYKNFFAEKPQSSTTDLINNTQITSSQPSLSPTAVTPFKPTTAPVSNGEIIAYNPNPAWQTYTDAKAGFSIQYGPKSKISKVDEGKEVSFLSCLYSDLTKSDVCSQSYTIRVYDNYDGGSRREWLLNKNQDLKSYDLSFEEVIVSGSKSLIVYADDPASMSFTYVLMPKNNKMYELFYRGGKKSGDLLKTQILSTFKFTN